jgi:hypothetical protein
MSTRKDENPPADDAERGEFPGLLGPRRVSAGSVTYICVNKHRWKSAGAGPVRTHCHQCGSLLKPVDEETADGTS